MNQIQAEEDLRALDNANVEYGARKHQLILQATGDKELADRFKANYDIQRILQQNMGQ